ncbi:MAG: hypothetical protein CBC40_06790 [bacterium TMED80]|nr:MAG: hypothetical protein CBC40_06790 [bacterium TMED80]RZP23357.1 MAG: hypothetical protein EVA24_05530 [bacterium]|tara:strand:- start:4986 stop:5627 length:642 start_codon:yes stop_codon:yes gene_type:complete
MVNIQIRGNLIDIEITSISKYNFDNFSTGEFSNDQIKDFLINSTDCKTIYKSTLPIIEQNSELQVTSFENDNYYDDGYTFLRSTLSDITSKDVNLKISLDAEGEKFIIIILKYGYGAAFETELMDLDYRSFENNELQNNATKLFDGANKVITSTKLNYLPLEDLRRSKYDIVSEQIMFFNKNSSSAEINLSDSLENQGDIALLRGNNSSGKKN